MDPGGRGPALTGLVQLEPRVPRSRPNHNFKMMLETQTCHCYLFLQELTVTFCSPK